MCVYWGVRICNGSEHPIILVSIKAQEHPTRTFENYTLSISAQNSCVQLSPIVLHKRRLAHPCTRQHMHMQLHLLYSRPTRDTTQRQCLAVSDYDCLSRDSFFYCFCLCCCVVLQFTLAVNCQVRCLRSTLRIGMPCTNCHARHAAPPAIPHGDARISNHCVSAPQSRLP